MQPILSLRLSRFPCACIAYVAVFWSACMTSMCCAHCVALRTAAWKLTFKSVFVGLHAVSKLLCATRATQRTHGLWRNQKTEICNACTRKTLRSQSILFFACVVFFVCVHCMCCDFFNLHQSINQSRIKWPN